MKKDDFRPAPQPLSPEAAQEQPAAPQQTLAAHVLNAETPHPRSEMATRFVDAHQDVTYAGETVPPHSHEFHELICCIGGSADYLFGQERIHTSHGDILSIPAGLSHSVVIPENPAEPYRRYVLWLSQEYLQILQTMFLGESLPSSSEACLFPSGAAAWEHLAEYFHRCIQESERRLFRWDAAVFGIATELSVHLARLWQGMQGDEQDKPELLDQITRYVENHLSERITLADAASRFWVSQSTVSQLFRRRVGVSFYRYVTLRRLSESKVLIKSGIPMEQVSISVGFQDYSSFYRAFKAEYGLSPAQYRKSH